MRKINLIIFMIVMGLVVLMVKMPFVFAALQYQETYLSQTGTNKVLILVNSAIYDAIYASALKQYIADLEAEDYNVILTKFINGTPQEIKDYMKTIPGLKGVIFIGDLPVASYEIANDFINQGINSIFPIDLFYMDLDGIWEDKDNNGNYDEHSGNLFAEIWLGRLTASPIKNPEMDEVGILRNFFAKDYVYRRGGLSIKSRALSYLDDDWASVGKCSLDSLYSDVTVIDDKIVTTAPDYEYRLKENYEWITLVTHSDPNYHYFGSVWGLSTRYDFSHQQGESCNDDWCSYLCWCCRVTKHSANYMCYRSCIVTQGLAGRDALVRYQLLIDNNTGNNDKVAILDVYDETSQRIIASVDVYRYDFDKSERYRSFNLSFIMPPAEHKIVFRNYWLGTADITDSSFMWSVYPAVVCSEDIRNIKPDVTFYNLYACSNARYTKADYMGGNYIFAKTNGLAAVGSTKSGSMRIGSMVDFYQYLGVNLRENLGEAYKGWFNSDGILDKSWHYGMTLLGDPTLTLDPPIATIDSIVITGGKITFIGSGKISNGSFVDYSWRSSINGFLSNKNSFSSSLSAGAHSIYFKVKDDKGRWSSEDKKSLDIPLSLLSPNGGEQLVVGQTYNIKWDYVGMGNVVTIMLLAYNSDGSQAGSPIPINTVDTALKSYNWVVPNNLPIYPQYKVRIAGMVFGGTKGIDDYSDNYFNIKPVLSAPTNLTAQALSSKEIKLTWIDNSGGELGYKIERGIGSTGPWTLVKTVGANITTYTDSSLTPQATYPYRVYAYNSTGSIVSNMASARTLFFLEPTNLTAQVLSFKEIKLTWKDNSTEEDYFGIERGPNSTGPWTLVKTVGANITTYTDSDLLPNTIYFYRVFAYHSTGSSPSSIAATATTLSLPAPTNLTAQALSFSEIGLTWKNNSIGGDGFKIERSLSSTGPWTLVKTVGVDITTWTELNLRPTTTYYYRVYAYYRTDNSAYSNVANAKTLILPAPTNLTAQAVSIKDIKLTWTDSSGGEQGFNIERGTSASGPWTLVKTVGTNIAAYTDSGVTPNTKCYYRVCAFYYTSSSAYSNVANAKTLVFSAPTNLTAQALSFKDIKLTWKDNSTEEDYFGIERGPNSTGPWTFVKIVSANITTYTDTSAAPNTTYYYRVYGYASGFLAYSNVANAKTLILPAPTNLTAQAVSSKDIKLTWTDNSTVEEYFAIERGTSSTGPWTFYKIVNANITTYTDTSAAPNTTYYYRVYAYSAGFLAYSNVVSVKTLVLPAPTNLTAQALSSSKIKLTWKDNSNEETGFKIERSLSSSGPWTYVGLVGTNVTTDTHWYLIPNTTYYYRVYAYHNTGNSAYSNVASVKTKQ